MLAAGTTKITDKLEARPAGYIHADEEEHEAAAHEHEVEEYAIYWQGTEQQGHGLGEAAVRYDSCATAPVVSGFAERSAATG